MLVTKANKSYVQVFCYLFYFLGRCPFVPFGCVSNPCMTLVPKLCCLLLSNTESKTSAVKPKEKSLEKKVCQKRGYIHFSTRMWRTPPRKTGRFAQETAGITPLVLNHSPCTAPLNSKRRFEGTSYRKGGSPRDLREKNLGSFV